MKHLLISVLSGIMVTATVQVVHAEEVHLNAQNGHPFWIGFSGGLTKDVKWHTEDSLAPKIDLEVGYHFRGETTGPALAIAVQKELATAGQLEVGPKFVWDLPLSRRFGLTFRPSVMLGYAYASMPGQWCVEGNTCTVETHALVGQIGLEASLHLLERLVLTLRPAVANLQFGGFAGEMGTRAKYETSAGVGFVF